MLQSSAPHRTLAIPFWEFVVLCAMMTALTALSVDIMLPALPEIGKHFAVADPNRPQTMVTSYMLGFALGQLIAGPLSDRFGRKPVLMAGLIVFLGATVLALSTESFELLLASRVIQGVGGAAPRIVSVAIIRDLFAGRDMARVMSFVMMVFIMVPVIAPALGGALIQLGDWTWTFWALMISGALTMAWSQLRMPETMPPGHRLELSVAAMADAWRQVVTTPVTMVYSVSMGLLFGCLLGYVSSAQQIFVITYGLGNLFPVAFGVVAFSMAFASFANARLVGRLGMRRLSHMALAGFVLVALCLAALELAGAAPVAVFIAAMAMGFFLFGLIFPNFNAMAMEPHGDVAGTASSFLGFLQTGMAAVIGWAVGQTYDGTSLPLAAAFTILGLATLALVRIGDRNPPGPIGE